MRLDLKEAHLGLVRGHLRTLLSRPLCRGRGHLPLQLGRRIIAGLTSPQGSRRLGPRRRSSVAEHRWPFKGEREADVSSDVHTVACLRGT